MAMFRMMTMGVTAMVMGLVAGSAAATDPAGKPFKTAEAACAVTVVNPPQGFDVDYAVESATGTWHLVSSPEKNTVVMTARLSDGTKFKHPTDYFVHGAIGTSTFGVWRVGRVVQCN